MDFNEIFHKASNEIKQKFLDTYIRQNNELKKEFIKYVDAITNVEETTISTDTFFKDVSEKEEQYRNKFEDIDLENPDWEAYKPESYGYIEEWEQYQQASEQEFEEIFSSFNSEIIDYIIQHKPEKLVATTLGLYEACANAEIDDPCDSFDTVNDYLLDELSRIMAEIISKIEHSTISGDKIDSSCNLFFEYCDKEYPSNKLFPKYFETLLLAIADKSDSPSNLLSFLDKSNIGREILPKLVLQLNKNSGNDSEWLQNAETYYEMETDVAKQLCDYYYKNDIFKYIKLAHELFEKDKEFWAEHLQHTLSAELDEDLYIENFYKLATKHQELKYYLKINKYLKTEQKKQLISEIEYNKRYLVEILEVENQYEEIREVVRKNYDSWDFNHIISPIIAVYPKFCFNTIKTKSNFNIKKRSGAQYLSAGS